MIKQTYLQNIEKLKQAFEEDKEFPYLNLFDFLEKEFYQQLKNEIKGLNFKKEKQPLTHSYSKADAGKLLIDFVASKDFKELIKKITNKKIDTTISVYNLSWRDYIILNDQKKEESKLDIIIDFTEKWADSFGGSLIYVNGTGDYLMIPIKENTISIVKKKMDVNSFIKYVNNHAKNKERFVVIISF